MKQQQQRIRMSVDCWLSETDNGDIPEPNYTQSTLQILKMLVRLNLQKPC